MPINDIEGGGASASARAGQEWLHFSKPVNASGGVPAMSLTQEVVVDDEGAGQSNQSGLLGGSTAQDAEVLVALVSWLGLSNEQGAPNQEAIANLFLNLCSELKRFALSGALGESENGRDLAQKMDELKDQIVELQSEIQDAVSEVAKAEAEQKRAGVANLCLAWAGVVAAALGAVLTAGAATPLLAMAVAGAICSAVGAGLQTAVFAEAKGLDPSSESYQRGTTALMAMELVLCLGATSGAAFAGPKAVKAGLEAAGKTSKSVADDALEGAVEKTLSRKVVAEKLDDAAPSVKAPEATPARVREGPAGAKPARSGVDSSDEEALEQLAKEFEPKAKVEGPAGAKSARSGADSSDEEALEQLAKEFEPKAGKEAPSDKPDDLAPKTPDDDLEQPLEAATVREQGNQIAAKEMSINLNFNMQRFAALIDGIEVAGRLAASAVNVKATRRITEAQIKSMDLKSKSNTTESALQHVQQDRALTDQRRDVYRRIDTDLQNSQLDQIQKDREVGLDIAEWRRY